MALCARAQRLLDSLPGYYYEDPFVATVLDAVCRELDRVEDFLRVVQSAPFPQQVDDSYGLLRNWERMLTMQEAPPGVDDSQRRTAILAHRRRNALTGAGWRDAMTEVLQGATWDATEVPGRRVVITTPYVGTTWQAGTALRYARRITPAHLDVISGYSQGFLLGTSNLGDAL